MLNIIKNVLEQEKIDVWQVRKSETKRAELYFVKKELDIPRFSVISEYEVAVYRDFEENGNKYRGVSVCYVEDGQTEKEVKSKIKNAFYAAQFVKNPWYELPEQIKADKKPSKSDMAGKDMREIANGFADAVLSVQTDSEAFINSLEIFVYRTYVEILGSGGMHVSYEEDRADGEFVAQCVRPSDVEQYRRFSYDNFDTGALKKLVESAIDDVRKRANAKNAPKNGTYNVILTGEHLKTFLNYYCMRGNASIIYPQYSDWKKGDCVQKEGGGEKISIDLLATAPYSGDGVEMKDMTFIENGTLENIYGGTRFMRYLGEKPTGNYGKMRVRNGTAKFEDMKKEGTLETVSFSDFQMDFFTGNFGGEIRLALLRENGSDIPLSGGSINGKLSDVEDRLVFSTEKYEDSEYSGPYAVLIPDVPVAGE